MSTVHSDRFVCDSVGEVVDALAAVCSPLPPIMLDNLFDDRADRALRERLLRGFFAT